MNQKSNFRNIPGRSRKTDLTILPGEKDKMASLSKKLILLGDEIKIRGNKLRNKPGNIVVFTGLDERSRKDIISTLELEGKYTIYRVNLSTIISKFIGETEKNLLKVFGKAKSADSLLFFDEADALFGKRAGVKESGNRYANKEISHLLDRMEDYPGLIILSSNTKEDIDAEFVTRFRYFVHFPPPDPSGRKSG